jgi:hypothetical protein
MGHQAERLADRYIEASSSRTAKFDENTVKKIERLTDENQTSESYVLAAKMLGAKAYEKKFELIAELVKLEGHRHRGLGDYQYDLLQQFLHFAKQTLDEVEYQALYSAL